MIRTYRAEIEANSGDRDMIDTGSDVIVGRGRTGGSISEICYRG